MGFWSSVGSFCSSVASFASSAISSIGGAIGAAVSAINPVLGLGISMIAKVAGIAHTVMQGLGLFKPEEKMDDMGDRMMQAAEAGIKPEGYDKFDDYMAEIRSRKLDPEKSKETPTEVKLAAGLTLSTMALEDKFKGSVNIPDIWLLASRNSDYFNAGKIGSLLENVKDIKSVADYFDGKLNTKDAMSMEKTLFNMEKAVSPDKDDRTIYEELKKA